MVTALVLLLLALIGVPLFAVIGLGALLAWNGIGVDLQVIAIELYRLAEMPVLVAIPLFTFAGYLLSESGAPGRLVRLTDALLGWLPGGLALVALAACALFTAFTGAPTCCCWITTPYRISGSDGANSSPRMPDVVTRPRLKRSG